MSTNTPINPVSVMATSPNPGKKSASNGTWYQAMAEAWGQTLDQQASTMETLAAEISNGGDKPSTLTLMSAESLKMGFLAQSSHTALSSTGEALKTMAQKS
jgi:hypothetical protein